MMGFREAIRNFRGYHLGFSICSPQILNSKPLRPQRNNPNPGKAIVEVCFKVPKHHQTCMSCIMPLSTTDANPTDRSLRAKDAAGGPT